MSYQKLQPVVALNLKQLAVSTKFSSGGLLWEFPNTRTARQHLRVYEAYFSHWGFLCRSPEVTIRAIDSGREWKVSPRNRGDMISSEVSPVIAFQPINDDPDYLLVAEQRLSAPLVAALVELRQSPGIKGVVNWSTQKQVILTTDCSQILIGEELEDCLQFSRQQYWYAQDFESFMQQCHQELREDGSNSIEFRYRTFDPTTREDWIECCARYRMIDAGRLGFYQLAENIDFAPIASPE